MDRKSSKQYPFKEIAWNILAVAAGIFASIGIFYFLFLATALLPQRFNSIAFLMVLLGFAAFAGGFTTAVMATRHKFTLALISSLALLIVFIHFFDANFTERNYPDEILQLVIIFLLSTAGGVIGRLPSKRTGKQ